MKAFVWHGSKRAALEERPAPVLLKDTDAIVKVQMSAICTSDIHIIKGFVPRAKEGVVLGHEFTGEIVEVGKSVKNLKKGDRVAANCITFCGQCWFCKRGFINNCACGGRELGCTIDGCQAEYIRVPYAQSGLTKLPDNVSYKDALLVGDILSSGYFGAEMCQIKNKDTIAVIGAGPVGMCAMMCSKVLGAGKIIAIDIDEKRLELAKDYKLADYILNPNTVNIEKCIKELTKNRGADGVIEAAGNSDTFQIAWKIARANAVVAIVAMYENNQILPLPVMYGKNLTFKTGGVDAVHCSKLLNLISEKKIDTNFLITHQMRLCDIKEAYEIFENKVGGCIKIAVIP